MANLTLKNRGELVQFLSDGKADIRSLKVHFTPKQAGEGTPSPDNVREISGWNGVEVMHCGKNIANLNSDEMLSYAWTRVFPNPFKKAGKYTISCQNQIIASGQLGTFVFLGNAVTDNSGYGLTGWTFGGSTMRVVFNVTEAALSNKYIIFRFNGNPTYSSISDAKIQIEEGITATSYEPYNSNIRLPSEYQEVEYIESTGTQWIDLNFGFLDTDEVEIKGAILHSNGGDKYLVSPSVWNDNTNRFAMGGGLYDKFRICFGDRGSAAQMSPSVDVDSLVHTWVYKDRKFSIDDTLSTSNVQNVTFSGETKYLKLFYGYIAPSKGQIYSYHHKKANGTEINLIPCYRKSDSKPGMYDTVTKTFYTNQGTGEFLVGPSVNKYDVDWTEELGSVYGGYVDLVSGEVVKEWENKDAGTLNWNHQGVSESYPYGFNYVNVSGKLKGIANVICEEYPTTSPASYSADKVSFGNAQNSVLYIIDSNYETASAFKAAMSGVKIVYELTTPITLTTLSPDILKTLTGKNTFWSNADYIEIEYDLIETQQTWMNRINMVNSMQPHIEAASGSLVSFKTDMASKLKECRVHFTPVQEGSGDPSPDNVRPISGWDGVTVTRCGKNLFDKDAMTKNYGYLDSTGKWVDVIQTSGWKVTEYIQINGSIVYDGITTPGNAPYCVWYDSNKNIISTFKAQIGRTIVVPPNNAQFVRFSVIEQPRNNIYDQDTFVLFDSTLEITIPFPQTIYGGYVDLVKGEVVEEWGNASIDELNWTLFTNTQSRQAWRTSGIATVIKKISDGNASPTAISQSFRQVSYNGSWGTYAISQSSQGTVFLTVPSSSYNTAEEFITALAGEIIVYQLATPTTYPLDPVTIRTLRGLNNLWSDANGNIEIKYWKR